MHEFSLVKTLLGQVKALHHERPDERPVAISVTIGEFSGVDPELFEYAYQTLVEETPLYDVHLQVHRVALQSCCESCGHQFTVERFRFQCPTCQGQDVTIVRGQELVLESVTFEQQEDSPL